MPFYDIVFGKVGRLEDGVLKTYRSGERIEMEADQAVRIGAQLTPADRAAATAIVDATHPPQAGEAQTPAAGEKAQESATETSRRRATSAR